MWIRRKRAFTLAETIMTLVVISLVVAASIPVFTQKAHIATDNPPKTPWGYCDEVNKKGLCTTNNIILRSDGVNTAYQYDFAGSTLNYDFSLNDATNRRSIFEIIQSDRRWLKVGNRNFILDKNNLIMSDLANAGVAIPNGDNNILIGDQPTSGSNNVVIGNTQVTGSDNIVINNNSAAAVNSDNSIVFGTSTNSANNSIVIGNGNSNAQAGAVVIGSNIANPANTILNIGGVFTATNADIKFADNNAQITFAGTFATANAGSFSDIRLKNIKGAYDKGLKEILTVEPVLYTFKADKTNSIRTGVIAQDIQKTFPEAVVKMPDGYYAITTDPMFFAMMNSLKEVNEKTLAQEKKQQELEKELKTLTKEIETLSACKVDNGFWSRIKCFFFDVKLFFKDKFGQIISYIEKPRHPEKTRHAELVSASLSRSLGILKQVQDDVSVQHVVNTSYEVKYEKA